MVATDDFAPLPTRELLEEIVMALVDNPEAVQVEELRTPDEVVFTVLCAADDCGKVLGRQYRCLHALSDLIARVENKTAPRHVVVRVAGTRR